MRALPRGTEWGRVLVTLAVGLFLIAIAVHWFMGIHVEMWVLFGVLVLAYMGGKMQDSALADGTLDKLTNSAVLILGAVPWGRRAYDKIVSRKSGPQEAVIVARPDAIPPASVPPIEKDD